MARAQQLSLRAKTPVDCSTAVGVVVIGRNEGELLHRCLTAPGIQGLRTVYVDSGSTDGSLELAGSLGIECVALDAARPFSVARGRNAGVAHLRRLYSELTFIQFLDGDVEIADEFIDRAYVEMQACSSVGAVAGVLLEDRHMSSKYKRLCDMEWRREPGDSDIFSGNVMLRVSSLDDTGYYDEGLSSGEDHDLAMRFRKAGWIIRTIEAPMGLHESKMHSFGQWRVRVERHGFGVAEATDRYPDSGNSRKQVRSIAFWGGGVPLLIAVSALLGLRKRFALLGLGAGVLYPLQWWRLRGQRLALDDSEKDAQLYATFVLIGKFVELRGMLRYYQNRTGTPQRNPS